MKKKVAFVKRKVALVLLAGLMLALIPATPTSACSMCVWTLYCYGQDCEVIEYCDSIGMLQFEECYMWWFGCEVDGDVCRFA